MQNSDCKMSSSLWTSSDFDSRLHYLQIDFLRSRKTAFKPQKQICSATILLTCDKSENVESCFDAKSLKLDVSWLEDKNKAAGRWVNEEGGSN